MNRVWWMALACAVSGPAIAQDAQQWTIDDLLFEESASSFAVSADGRWVAWVRAQMDKETGRRAANLWITRVADGESWALTRGTDTHGSPQFSPDGRYLAFTSSREPRDKSEAASGSQLWIMRLDGGEPWPLTTDVRGLRGFAWKGQRSDTLVFAAQEQPSRLELARKKKDDTSIAVEDTLDAPPVRLWSVAVGSRAVRRLTTNADWIETLAVAPDGRRAVTRNAQSLSYEFDQRVPPRTYLVNLETGAREEVNLGDRVTPDRIAWAPDGSGWYFSYEYSTHPMYRTATISLLAFYDMAARRVAQVDLGWDRGIGSFAAVPDGFVAWLPDGVRDRAARYVRRGATWRPTPLQGDHVANTWAWAVSPSGQTIAYVTSTANTPPQPYVARLEGSRVTGARRVAELNAGHANKPKPRVELVRWVGARGDSVEGLLYYPLEWREGRPYPVVVSPHGGPASRDRDAWVEGWHDPYVLLNQKGAFVFRINYHGSSGYGLDWVESIAGGAAYYDLPLEDIERGVDVLIARGLAHRDSIAAAGWSNGAILSTALVVRNPERYRALVAGAGDVEWISDWGNVDFGAAFDNYYLGASPLEDPERYIAVSPFFQLDRVRAPTLIFFGTEDRNVPPSQGWSHFRALQQLGNTAVRFVLFPGEPHGLRQLAHQRRKVEEELAWLDRHLWGRLDTANPALAPESPLAALVQLRSAARVNDLYGITVNGILAPETVQREGLMLGRFEVTRAQWRQFRPAYDVTPGAENHPVNDVSFEDAQAYVAWLSERTGRRYRLPTAAELEPLANRGGVTLDYWAGYVPNPDDVGRLERLVAALGAGALLKPVGSFAGDAEGPGPHVYDLGGNVAEWARTPEGGGTLVGGSADRPRDPKARSREPGAGYRGLRVVLESR